METAEDFIVEAELGYLREVADGRGWVFQKQGERQLLLGLPASDETWFYTLLDCTGYRTQPPAWHWSDESSKVLDDPRFTPKGRGFLHSSGRICAPWNRLAYSQVDTKGPHKDWELETWVSNPKTGQCTTLAAMALRIFVELQGDRYFGERHA